MEKIARGGSTAAFACPAASVSHTTA